MWGYIYLFRKEGRGESRWSFFPKNWDSSSTEKVVGCPVALAQEDSSHSWRLLRKLLNPSTFCNWVSLLLESRNVFQNGQACFSSAPSNRLFVIFLGSHIFIQGTPFPSLLLQVTGTPFLCLCAQQDKTHFQGNSTTTQPARSPPALHHATP